MDKETKSIKRQKTTLPSLEHHLYLVVHVIVVTYICYCVYAASKRKCTISFVI